jgi:D-3-phosphoglycerate dehydrogenase
VEHQLSRKRIVAVEMVIVSQAQLKRLQSLGEVTIHGDDPKDTAEIIRRIGESEIVITGYTPLSGEVIRSAPNLEMISLWSVGYNHIDLSEASRRQVLVCNARGATAVSVAEHAIAMVLALAKRLPEADAHVRQGGYDWGAFLAMELAGKTFGIIGTGSIGSYVAKLARGFECRAIASTKHPSPERAARLGVEYVSLDTLLRESDIICVSVSLNPETEGIIGRQEFEKMARKPILVNIARGRVLDQQALFHALRTGQISGAGLDVLAEEPPPEDEALLREKNVILTPHMAANTPETLANLTRICIDNIAAYLEGAPQNIVT